jgi:NADH-quinone oxidoreductase subunit G
MPKLIIDNREIGVPQGTNVLEAAERLGIMIPRFCYHAALGSLGACRVCAVMFLEGPFKGVEMSCMTEAKDGMVVSTDHPEAMDFRRYVIEWLMLNHPLDCPVCDEGGHCLLQDETVSGGHGLRRYLGPKRTYHDQYLGGFVQHEMNRCIQCWRCRRFYQDFTGYRDLGALQIGNRTYFGRFRDGALESPFAGNLIDICPTGVYTDKPARFKGRRWNFERAPSLCLHCSLGCNTTGSARYREVMRQEARLNEAVNGYFICDRGRYGFPYANLPERPRRARLGGEEVLLEEALRAAAKELARIRREAGAGAIACWGSPRSSLETQGTLVWLCRRQGWPEPQFFATASQERKVKAAVSRLDGRLAVSLRELEGADIILAVGADPLNEAPMLALALRQAVRAGGRVAVLDPRPVELPFAFDHLALPPGLLEPALSALVKKALAPEAAAKLPDQARQFYQTLPEDFQGEADIRERLAALAAALGQSRRPVLVCGTEVVRDTTPALVADHALLLQAAGQQAGLFYLLPGANACGAALLSGLPPAPEPTDLGQWPWGPRPGAEAAKESPKAAPSPEDLRAGMERGEIKALVLVECDPFWCVPDRPRLAKALDNLELLVVLDYLPTPAVERAHFFLPTTTLFEGTPSSWVNQEGRVQQAAPVHRGGVPLALISPERHPPRSFLNYVPGGDPRPAAEMLAELARDLPEYGGGPELWQWLARRQPLFKRAAALTPQAGARLLPDIRGADDFAARRGESAPTPAEHLELLLVEATFGTEELGSYSPLLREVEAPPRLALHPREAARLELAAGDRVSLHLPGGSLTVEIQVCAQLAPGVLVLPRHRLLNWRLLPDWPLGVPVNHLTKVQG